MKLSGQIGQGNPYRDVVVVFNATGQTVNVNDASLRNLKLELHPVLAASTDAVVKTSRVANGALSVPGLTTAVFVGK
jgi:pullulanase